MCHTPQLAAGAGRFTSFIHKIHMGEELPTAETPVGLDVSEIKYPQDQRNCATCHKGALVVDSWKVKPTLGSLRLMPQQY